jgi:hypothetical protein
MFLYFLLVALKKSVIARPVSIIAVFKSRLSGTPELPWKATPKLKQMVRIAAAKLQQIATHKAGTEWRP